MGTGDASRYGGGSGIAQSSGSRPGVRLRNDRADGLTVLYGPGGATALDLEG